MALGRHPGDGHACGPVGGEVFFERRGEGGDLADRKRGIGHAFPPMRFDWRRPLWRPVASKGDGNLAQPRRTGLCRLPEPGSYSGCRIPDPVIELLSEPHGAASDREGGGGVRSRARRPAMTDVRAESAGLLRDVFRLQAESVRSVAVPLQFGASRPRAELSPRPGPFLH